MIYKKLKKTYSNGYANWMPRFKKEFPALSKYSNEELADKFQNLKMDFYYEEQTKVKFWVRLTMPLALIFIVLAFISLPIGFLINGDWGYNIKRSMILFNWLKSLKLID